MDTTSTAREAVFAELRRTLSGRADARPVSAALPSATMVLAPLLPEGLPVGTISVLQGAHGVRSFAARILRENEAFTALLDDGSWHAPSLARCGINLERLLVIPMAGGDTALLMRLLDVLLRVSACSYVVMHGDALGMMNWQPARFARLQDMAARGTTRVIIITNTASARVFGAAHIRLECTLNEIAWLGTHGPLARAGGYDLTVSVAAHRRNAVLIGKSMRVHCTFEAAADAACALSVVSPDALYGGTAQTRGRQTVMPLRRIAS